MKITIISGSVRTGRQTPKVAQFLEKKLAEHEVFLIDLAAYNFPVFEERLRLMSNPPQILKDLSQQIAQSDALILVSPEYNGTFSAALKNFMDVFYAEYAKKPIGIAMVSSGKMGGMRAAPHLQSQILYLNAFPLPRILSVAQVGQVFDENMNVLSEEFGQNAQKFLDDLLWLADAIRLKKQQN